MKKLILSILCICILNLHALAVYVQDDGFASTLQPEKFENIIPSSLKYEYIEPIERPKWAYPLAWVGYIGTALIIPFPIFMLDKDSKIKNNNAEYEKMKNYEKKYYSDIDKCNIVFETNQDLYRCYQEVKLYHHTLLNNILAEKNQAIMIDLQDKQLKAQNESNYIQTQQYELQRLQYLEQKFPD